MDLKIARDEARRGSVERQQKMEEQPSDIGDGTSESEKTTDLMKILDLFKEQWVLASMLLFIPFGIYVGARGPEVYSREARFLLNFFSILPMAWLIGKATEDVAAASNSIIGGLVNATFGNIVEMLLCFQGIVHEEYMVVQLTLIGSILSNLLLVMGTAFLYGGYYHESQSFNSSGAKTHCSLLTLSVLAISLPTVYRQVLSEGAYEDLLKISRVESVFLLSVYGQYLFFQLRTHSHLFEEAEDEDGEEEEALSFWTAAGILGMCTVLTAMCTDYLIESIAGNLSSYLNKIFISVILLPIIGNAAEHYTAIIVAGRNKMDLALGVAVGSSVQMALLVTPATVIFGWMMDKPVDLDFHTFQAIVLVLSVIMTSSILVDGTVTWLHGSLLLTTYLIISTIYFLESTPAQIKKMDYSVEVKKMN
jgi:Ca2+:H+ antiporter